MLLDTFVNVLKNSNTLVVEIRHKVADCIKKPLFLVARLRIEVILDLSLDLE